MGCSLSSCNAGKMRHKVKFQRVILEQDSIGGSTTSYETYREAWAEVVPFKSFQKWQAQQLSLRVTHKIKCRYFDGIKSDDRIEFKGRFFEVQEVINVEERNLFYEISANEGDAS